MRTAAPAPRLRPPFRSTLVGAAAWSLALVVIACLAPPPASAHPDGSYPRIFNFDWRNRINVVRNSKYDVLVHTSRVPNTQLDSLRLLNPMIRRLVVVNWYLYYNAGPSGHPAEWGPFDENDPLFGWDRKFWDLLQANGWWLSGRDSAGTKYKAAIAHDQWSGNFSSKCPKSKGQRLCDVFADFLADHLLSQRNIEGIYFDNCWDHPFHLHWQMWGTCPSGSDCTDPSVPRTPETAFYVGFDMDEDGVADHPDSLKKWWYEGVSIFMNRLRERMGPNFILIGNGQHNYTMMNGAMNERFPRVHGALDPEPNPYLYRWYGSMLSAKFGYLSVWQTYFSTPRYLFLDMMAGAWSETQPARYPEFERYKRWALASTLLGDGYFGMRGPGNNTTWWEPEYDLRLGWPSGPAYTQVIDGITIYRRNYTNGEVWVNPSNTGVAATATSPALPAWDAFLQQYSNSLAVVSPPRLNLSPPWPNPTTARTTIEFDVDAGVEATLSVVDVRGRLVRRLWRGVGNGVTQAAWWDGQHDLGGTVPAGVYMAVLTAGDRRESRRMVRLSE